MTDNHVEREVWPSGQDTAVADATTAALITSIAPDVSTSAWAVPESVRVSPYFVRVETSMADALRELDRRMTERGEPGLIKKMRCRRSVGHTLESGQIGLLESDGRPYITFGPNSVRLPAVDKAMGTTWHGTAQLSNHCSFMGLCFAQVSQLEAMVVLDPENRAFVVRNGGFAAYGGDGRFQVLAVLQPLNLGEKYACYADDGSLLGFRREVTAPRLNDDKKGTTDFTVATFYDVPANNTAILQRGDYLEATGAGQFVVIDEQTSFRGFYTYSQRERQFLTKPAYTLEGVPVVLMVYLCYRVADALLLARHYSDPVKALDNPAQTTVNAVVSKSSFRQFMKASSFGVDSLETNSENMFFELFKQECLEVMRHQARENGIDIISFNVLHRELQGHLGQEIEKNAEKVVENQMIAQMLELNAHIDQERKRNELCLAEIDAQKRRVVADVCYYEQAKSIDAKTYATKEQAAHEAQHIVQLSEAQSKARTFEINTKTFEQREQGKQQALNIVQHAKARSEARRVEHEQRADAIIKLAEARAEEICRIAGALQGVHEGHAQNYMMAQMDVEMRRALPANTMWIHSEGSDTGGGSNGNAGSNGKIGDATALGVAMTSGIMAATRQTNQSSIA